MPQLMPDGDKNPLRQSINDYAHAFWPGLKSFSMLEGPCKKQWELVLCIWQANISSRGISCCLGIMHSWTQHHMSLWVKLGLFLNWKMWVSTEFFNFSSLSYVIELWLMPSSHDCQSFMIFKFLQFDPLLNCFHWFQQRKKYISLPPLLPHMLARICEAAIISKIYQGHVINWNRLSMVEKVSLKTGYSGSCSCTHWGSSLQATMLGGSFVSKYIEAAVTIVALQWCFTEHFQTNVLTSNFNFYLKNSF